MAYNNYFPQGYQPYPQAYPQYPQQNQQNGIVWVQGIEGAKAHPVGAGQAVLLMDSDSNCLYLKSADQTGMPSLRIFDYKERVDTATRSKTADLRDFCTKDDLSHYVTKEDLKMAVSSLEEMIQKAGVADEQSDI